MVLQSNVYGVFVHCVRYRADVVVAGVTSKKLVVLIDTLLQLNCVNGVNLHSSIRRLGTHIGQMLGLYKRLIRRLLWRCKFRQSFRRKLLLQ